MSKTRSRFLAVAVITTQVAFAALLQPVAQAAPETYEIDAAHSSVGFRIKHFFSAVTGRFDDVKGSFTVDPDKVEDAKVEVVIKAASINTANEMRDKHLQGEDFFNVEKNPDLTFKSKSVKKTGDKTADVVGDLTLNGVTKEVPLKVEFLGKGDGMKGSYISGWSATSKIKRSEFGIKYGILAEGVSPIGDEVEIVIDVEAVRQGGATKAAE